MTRYFIDKTKRLVLYGVSPAQANSLIAELAIFNSNIGSREMVVSNGQEEYRLVIPDEGKRLEMPQAFNNLIFKIT